MNETTQCYMPRKANNNIKGMYKGFPLPVGSEYRPNNIEKANSILALAIQGKQNFFCFEVHNNLPSNFSNQCLGFDRDSYYLKMHDVDHIKLGIFTKKSDQEATEFLSSSKLSFTAQDQIYNVADTLSTTYEATNLAYSFAEDLMIPKASQKSKQMTGSDLTEEEKAMSLEFELKPTIVRRS
jgi:hypothetical protein